MTIVSPIFARGLRRNFFETYQQEHPSDAKNLSAAFSYSGYPFKSKRDFVAYFNNTALKLGKYAIYYDVKRSPSLVMHQVSVSTPKSKKVRGKSGDVYDELYLEFESYCLVGNTDKYYYDVLHYPIKMEVTSHTIERLYQRLSTTDFKVVRDEIASSINAFMQIHLAVMADETWQKPNSILIPTKNGAFLTDFSSDRRVLSVRTFIKETQLPSHEYSLNYTRKWLSYITENNITKQQANDLLTHPANRWWFDSNFDQKFTSRDPALDLDLA